MTEFSCNQDRPNDCKLSFKTISEARSFRGFPVKGGQEPIEANRALTSALRAFGLSESVEASVRSVSWYNRPSSNPAEILFELEKPFNGATHSVDIEIKPSGLNARIFFDKEGDSLKPLFIQVSFSGEALSNKGDSSGYFTIKPGMGQFFRNLEFLREMDLSSTLGKEREFYNKEHPGKNRMGFVAILPDGRVVAIYENNNRVDVIEVNGRRITSNEDIIPSIPAGKSKPIDFQLSDGVLTMEIYSHHRSSGPLKKGLGESGSETTPRSFILESGDKFPTQRQPSPSNSPGKISPIYVLGISKEDALKYATAK